MKTLSQILAEKVYIQVEQFGKNHSKGTKVRDSYCSMVERLPVLVHSAGLVQALAFLMSRGDDAYNALLNQLAAVLGSEDSDKLLASCQNAEFKEYRYLTHNVNIALSWFKRFAVSILDCKSKPEKRKGDS